jgi:serine/threonine-protein kinase
MITDLKPGMNVWRFRIVRQLARGGMGSVWAAWDERLDREVALKLLPHILINEPSAEARFEREALAMARLQHPNVVSIFDLGTFDPGVGEELPYLVMELIRGRSLNELIAEGPLPPRKAARIMEQASLALAAAHEVGVIHRDLKPSNIMVADGGHVTVLDFGLARLAQREGETPIETLTSPGMVLGSCPYMAPEQALGKGVSPRLRTFSPAVRCYTRLCPEFGRLTAKRRCRSCRRWFAQSTVRSPRWRHRRRRSWWRWSNAASNGNPIADIARTPISHGT